MTEYDVVVIGGGISGAAVARDAAGRGLKVYLAERDDFAQATSSASSKLIHGGLRYLEHYEFRLVRESLREREVMLKIAPHLTRPLRFLLPVTNSQPRPTWLYRAGLYLYQVLAGSARIEPVGQIPLPPEGDWDRSQVRELRAASLRAVLHYPDVQVDDSRLVIATLLDAQARGATVRNRAEVTRITTTDQGFFVELCDRGFTRRVRCRALINAAGPWADHIARLRTGGCKHQNRLKLVRGSHLVVRQPPGAPSVAYTLPLGDGRVVFVIPWLEGFRLIGTTDVAHEGPADRVMCSSAEEEYLLNAYNAAFRECLRSNEVISRWAGLRPLLDSGATSPSRLTRDYRLVTEATEQRIAVDIFGGKLTTHRRLAENVVQALHSLWPNLRTSWTAAAPLHGGALAVAALEELFKSGPALLSERVRRRWVYTYGSVAAVLFDRAQRDPGGAEELVRGVPLIELEHAREVEWAHDGADFLERRTKLVLELDRADQDRISAWFSQRVTTEEMSIA